MADLKFGHYLLGRRFGSAYVRVAQVPQHGLLVITHAPREVRIVQALIPRGLRHMLQDTELLLDNLLAIPRRLPPLGKHVVLDVLLLFWREVSPDLFLLTQIGLLIRRHAIPLAELLADLGLLIRREILKCFAVLQDLFALLR